MTELWIKGHPTQSGIYVIKMKKEKTIGFLQLRDGEWLSYPTGFSVNTLAINTNMIGYIGPIPND
jgi:hypothetical protein